VECAPGSVAVPDSKSARVRCGFRFSASSDTSGTPNIAPMDTACSSQPAGREEVRCGSTAAKSCAAHATVKRLSQIGSTDFMGCAGGAPLDLGPVSRAASVRKAQKPPRDSTRCACRSKLCAAGPGPSLARDMHGAAAARCPAAPAEAQAAAPLPVKPGSPGTR
jgi:hypothetical protein